MKIKLPKDVRKALGYKKKYIDLEDLLELVVKLVKRWLQGRGGQKRPSPLPAATETAAAPALAPARRGAPAWTPHQQQARQYQAEIAQLQHTAVSEFEQMRLERLAGLVADWVTAVDDLSARVVQFRQNDVIDRDRKQAPKAVADLEQRLAATDNPLVRDELARTLAHRRQQLAALEKLSGTMEWAEVKIESTVSMLGTIYAQLLISRSKGKVADYGRLLDEAGEEVAALHDYLAALQETKLGA